MLTLYYKHRETKFHAKSSRIKNAYNKDSDPRVLAVQHKNRNRSNTLLENLIWMRHNCHHLFHNHPAEARGVVTD